VKTVVLFFEKGRKTRSTWYYALDPERSLGKSSPLRDDELAEFVELQKTKADSPKSWSMTRGDIDEATFDMSVKNPFAPEKAPLRDPSEIIDDMLARDAETAEILAQIRGML
ncbi:MAG: type I restriction endonuclease subunit M, partial [Rhodobacteraceae bacterium]